MQFGHQFLCIRWSFSCKGEHHHFPKGVEGFQLMQSISSVLVACIKDPYTGYFLQNLFGKHMNYTLITNVHLYKVDQQEPQKKCLANLYFRTTMPILSLIDSAYCIQLALPYVHLWVRVTTTFRNLTTQEHCCFLATAMTIRSGLNLFLTFFSQ